MDRKYLKNKLYKLDEVDTSIINCKQFYDKDYLPKLLQNGNNKLPKNVLIWDMPSGITCKVNCVGCYAKKAERLYKNTRLMRAFHYEIVKQALQDNDKRKYLMNYIQLELDRHKLLFKNPIVRIHASGDFYSKEYIKLWLDIIINNPDIKFYTYTKQLDDDLTDTYNLMRNFNIVKSFIKIDDKKYINFGDMDYINKLKDKCNDIEICPYHIDDTKQCMINCFKCCNCNKVLFKKH